jgi:hypothetical protein
MPRNWETLADGSEGDYTVEDFQQALYQLVTQQCLYQRFPRQAVAYRLISRYRNEFSEAADLMGLKLGFNDRHSLCHVRQDVAKPQPMDLAETLFLLTLRQIYHQRSADQTPEGDVVVSLPELQESYKLLTGRDLDSRPNALDPLLKVARRSGLARQLDADGDDAQPYTVAILPGIADVLSEHAVNRFGAALKASLPVEPKTDDPDVAAGDPEA